MSQTNNKLQSLSSMNFIQPLSPETAANYSGGKVQTLTDVVLRSEENGLKYRFRSNVAVKDLSDFGFDNATDFIAVNNNQKWRFYEDANFKGKFIEVGGDEARNVGKFGRKISSFRAIS